MELIPKDVCMLCDQNTAVLAADCVTPYMKYMSTTFVDKSKNALDRFQEATAEKSFCALCVQKVIMSHRFKDTYEDISKKRCSFKKTRTSCFLCESKSGDLIQTDSNPNDFDTKIKSFMGSTLYPRPYLQCAMCLDCLFYLNVWFEVNLHVKEKIIGDEEILKSPEKQIKSINETSKKMQFCRVIRTPNTKNDGTAVRKDKENITPPENNNHTSQKRSLSESESRIETSPGKQKRNSTTVTDTDQELSLNYSVNGSTINENKYTRSKPTKNKSINTASSKKMHLFLKGTLKHLKCVREINNSTEWSVNIVEDKKMFGSIPYVLMIKDNKQNTSEETENCVHESDPVKPKPKTLKISEGNIRRSGRLNKAIEVIELSDSDGETNQKNESSVELEENTDNSPKKITTKTAFRRKNKIKIRIPSRFSHKANSSKYTCNVCDQGFKVNCDYKAHSLWHEKPENVVINVTRHNLPNQIKAAQFKVQQSLQEGKKTEPDADSQIDKILHKYVGFSASDTFEESEFGNSKEIENIIEKLDVNVEEQSKDSDELEKNKEINLEDQNKHDDHSETENNLVEQQDSENETVSPIISERDVSKTDVVEKDIENQTESETEGLENESKENENPETLIDTECTVPEKDSKDTNETATVKEHDATAENSTDNDSVQTEKEESHCHDNAGSKEIDGSDNQEEQDNEQNSTESNSENIENNSERSGIEKQLAKLHGEEVSFEENSDEYSDNNTNEKEQEEQDEEGQESNNPLKENINNDNSESTNGITNNCSDVEDISDNCSETDQVENEKEDNSVKSDSLNEDYEIDNKSNKKKRKRVGSLIIRNESEESGSDVEIITPKAKKVRFAMDYQSPNSVNEDTVPDAMSDQEEKDGDNSNNAEVVPLEIENSCTVE